MFRFFFLLGLFVALLTAFFLLAYLVMRQRREARRFEEEKDEAVLADRVGRALPDLEQRIGDLENKAIRDDRSDPPGTPK